jgi:carbon-monoxide dehydrogenase medium subunit
VTGAGQSGVYRLVQLEKNLLESFVDDAAANLEISTENLIEDMYATKDYRANLVKTMTHHALTHMGTISIFK